MRNWSPADRNAAIVASERCDRSGRLMSIYVDSTDDFMRLIYIPRLTRVLLHSITRIGMLLRLATIMIVSF